MPDFVRVQGRAFVKGGRPMLFRGLGVGSWLNLEHFMVGLPTPDHQIRAAVAEVFGPQTAGDFFQRFIHCSITQADMAFLKSCGVNLLRVPFNYRLFWDDQRPGLLKEEGFRVFDRLLDLCAQYQIYLLPDLHAVPGGQNPDWHSDNATGIPQFWHYKVFRDQMAALWGRLAERWAGREYLLGYDLLNEPYIIDAPDSLRLFYQDCTAAIRRVDPNHIIFQEGDHFAMRFDCLGEIEDPNTALTFHYYPTVWEPGLLDGGCARTARQAKFREILGDIASIRERFTRPILCGEAGYDIHRENLGHSMELLSDTLDLFEEAEISWTLWSYKDAQFMGLCWPRDGSPWMELAEKIHKTWTHYGEMAQANQLIGRVAALPGFSEASEELRYFAQFRQRGILYQFQRECLLQPVLRQYTEEALLKLPESFLFENCGYYAEYAHLLRNYCKP